jgi:hypothetical protein
MKSFIILDIIHWNATDVSEENVAFILRVEKKARHQLESDNKHSLVCFMLVSSFAYSSSLKMEATFSFETSLNFQWTIRRCITEYGTLHNHSCKKVKKVKVKLSL